MSPLTAGGSGTSLAFLVGSSIQWIDISHTGQTMPQQRRHKADVPRIRRHRILVFSADADLAHSLKLLLEDRYEVEKVTRLEQLGQSLKDSSPTLLLVDLFSTPQDGLKQLLYLERLNTSVPLLLLRAYRSNALIDDAIKRLNAYVFYKPVNIDLVVGLVQDLLSTAASHG